MIEDLRRLGDVYGVTRDLPLNYVSRAKIDGALIEALSRDKHIVIHGSSKQGKTSLRKWNLIDDDYVLVSCQSRWGLADLLSAILKRVGYLVEQSQVLTTSGGHKISAKASGKISGKLFGSGVEAGVEGGGERSRGDAVERTLAPLELDPADPNDIISALEHVDFHKFIVLEDFHYLPDETQAEFAVALKTFHEASKFVFVIIGVWLDENRLIQHNGDLTGRVLTVNADEWQTSELQEVINSGAALLNISFDKVFVDHLIAGSFESVWVIQEACYRACERAELFFEQERHVVGVGAGLDVSEIIREVVEAQSARYNGFLEHFPDGFQTTDYEMYRWLVMPVLSLPPTELERGVHINKIKEFVNGHHPKRPVADMSFLHALRSTSNLQVKKNIKPIVLDFDHTGRKLTVVDRGFLIWLQHQDRAVLLRQCGLPDSAVVS